MLNYTREDCRARPLLTMSSDPSNAEHTSYRVRAHLFQQRCAGSSLDHLIGSGEQCRGHSEVEHSGGLCVDDQLELGRLHNWKIRRLHALEDAAGVDADLTKCVRDVSTIA